ncbi:MAG: T9SS type A sorting domain-containing protein [Candidatus Cloacimonetes bacterium]|nr:T9SS type A sorting domain-containing protein [Candidatus Cloacimonadota bacterium]
MLKKLLIIALFVLIVIAYAQNIFWGDGLNVLKGNYIYYYESVKTDDNSVIVCWSEADQVNRKIKMQKILSNGDFAWEEPRTVIDENSPIMCDQLIESSDANLFTFTSNDYYLYEKINKFDLEGNIIWSKELDSLPNNSAIKEIVPDNNGGIYIFRQATGTDYRNIKAIHIFFNGTEVEKEILELYSIDTSISYRFHKAFIIGDKILLFYEEDDNYLTNCYDNSGNQVWETPISLGTINDYNPDYKSLNDKIFTAWLDGDDFLQAIDINGELLYQNEPILIEDIGYYNRDMLTGGENIILLFHNNNSSDILFNKYSLDGTLILQETFDLPTSYNSSIKFVDEQTDYILGFMDTSEEQYQYVAFPISESGIDTTPIILDNVILDSYYNVDMTYVTNEKFITLFDPMNNNNFTARLNNQDGSNPEQKLIRDVTNNFRFPKIFKYDEEIALFWSEYNNDQILYENIIDSDGNLVYDLNGIDFYDFSDIYEFEQEVIGDKSIIVTLEYDENSEKIACYQEFDLLGNPLTDEIVFYQSEYLNKVGILPCDEDSYYIYAIYTNLETSKENTLIQKITNGNYIWENPLIIVGWTKNIINNLIIYANEEYPPELNYAYFDDLGNLGNIVQLDNTISYNSIKALKHNDNTIISWIPYSSNISKIQYVDENGNLIWASPLSIYKIHEIFAEDDKFSTVKYLDDNSIRFCAYDYDKNLLEEHHFEKHLEQSFEDCDIKKVDNFFVITANFYNNWVNRDIKYSLIDDTGNTILDFGEDTFCDIPYATYVNQVLQDGKILYVLFSNYHCSYDNMSETDYFIQKMDFSDYTISDINNLSKPVLTTIAYPNPFNPNVNISYNLSNESNVSLEIFNIKGQKIKTILNKNQKAGNHRTIWQGNDENENKVSSGIYFYKFKTDQNEKIKKMILMK